MKSMTRAFLAVGTLFAASCSKTDDAVTTATDTSTGADTNGADTDGSGTDGVDTDATDATDGTGTDVTDSTDGTGTDGTGTDGTGTDGTGTDGTDGATTPCERAGGAAAVSSAIYDPADPTKAGTLVGALAADCKINTWFTSLPAESLNHTGECLAIQVQELFGCEGVAYAGSKDSKGADCRDMKATHAGLAISQGDFDALMGDVAAFATPLVTAGVLTPAELTAAAGALNSLAPAIVEKLDVADPTKAACEPVATPCTRAGGAAAVSAAIYDPADPTKAGTLVGALAADCKINTWFTSLSAEALNHTGECLAIQVQELFACDGVTYAGSKDSKGADCRDMKATHAGLAISQGDFDALMGDVAAFATPLVVAGVLTPAELTAAAGALNSLAPAIVEKLDVADPTKAACEPPSTPCTRAGGAAAVSAAIYDPAIPTKAGTLVGALAADCKINTWFTSLTPEALNHTGECLAIQVQELFACDGVTYAGSKDSKGADCRDMKATHMGLAISQGDFDALMGDVAAFATPLVTAGVLTPTELTAAAGALNSLAPAIVEDPASAQTKANCTP